MSKSSERVKSWRKATKQRMVAAMGGKCQCCPYDRCAESLDFHHIDPTQKEMSLGSVRANPKAWDQIVHELRKCILVCRNCHGELHYGVRELPETYARFDERYADFKNHEDFATPCGHCGKPKAPNRRFCSRTCSASAKMRAPIDWTQVNLEELIQTQSCRELADSLGCSVRIISEQLKKRGLKVSSGGRKMARTFVPYVKPEKPVPVKLSDIDPDWRRRPCPEKRKVEWPTKEVLEKLVWEKSMVQIGEGYGVWDNTVRKWAKSYGIDCPPQGYWQRREAGYSHEEALVSQAKITTPQRLITREIAEKAAALRLKGQSYRDIGTALGFGHWSIQNALRRYGLENVAAPAGNDPAISL